MTAVFEPPGQQSFFLTATDVNGKPYTVPNAGGFVYMYQPGSTVPQTTWQDSAQNVANPDPIRLDADGRCIIFGVGQYRQIVTDAGGSVQWDQLVELGLDQTFINTTLLTAPVTISGPNPNPPLGNPNQGTRGLAAVLGSFVDARNFGALRQGGDDLTVIQAAINYATSIGGATVYLGPGPLTTSNNTQLIWPAAANGISLKGDGPETTVLNISGGIFQDTFVLTAGNLAGCQIRDLAFNAPTLNGGSGALIHFANTNTSLVEDVIMSGSFYNGVLIEGGPVQHVCTLRDVAAVGQSNSNACILIGTDVTTPARSILIDNCQTYSSPFGIYFRNCDGVKVSNTVCQLHSIGIATSPAPSRVAQFIDLVGVFVYNCTGSGIGIGDSGGNTSFVSISNCYAQGNLVGIGIGSNPQENNISIVGCQIHDNAQSGIHNVGANAVLITNNLLAGNGTAAANTYDTILIESGLQNVVSNNFIGPAFGFPPVQRYAINLGGPTDYCVITGNVTGGGGTGSILNASSGTHNVVVNNTGT